MEDLLTAAKTSSRAEESPVKDTLKPIATRATPLTKAIVTSKAEDQTSRDTSKQKAISDVVLNNPKQVLDFLRSEPDAQDLSNALQAVSSEQGFGDGFSLHEPGPLQAQIINTIVSTILPNFWSVFGKQDQRLLLKCLANVTGISVLVTKLKLLSSQVKPGNSNEQGQPIAEVSNVLSLVLRDDEIILKIWLSLRRVVQSPTKVSLIWKEFVNLIGSGRIISTVAQAEDALRSTSYTIQPSWLATGSDYAAWIGRNIAGLVLAVDDEFQATTASAQLLTRSIGLGYPEALVSTLLLHSFRGDAGSRDTRLQRLSQYLKSLQALTRKRFLEHTIRWLSNLLPEHTNRVIRDAQSQDDQSSAITALLVLFVKDDTFYQQQIISMLSDSVASSSVSFKVRRACLAVLDHLEVDDMTTLLEKQMSGFGDRLFIVHATILQQESLAQNLLITAGYLHRKDPMAVLLTARSSSHMQGVSNRLETSNQRARWLGMVVGMALSELVDKEGAKMDFGTDDMKTEEAMWYRGLVRVDDRIGGLQDCLSLSERLERVKTSTKPSKHKLRTETLPIINGKQVFGPIRPPEKVQTEVEGNKITELLEDETDEEEDLKPYAKPDSDPEDSDDDATLVNRNKARPPVYIRTLMAMLQETENADRFQLAIKHAAGLIRRKTGFGREVNDHAEELSRTFCNLQDPFDTESFDEMRLQALIAVLLSDTKILAPWMSRQVFTGQYSIAQRCIMLTALGLSGRELAGYQEQDALNPKSATSDFPSKRLPSRLHAIYSPAASSVKRLEAARQSVEHELIQPMALQAADKSTAHLNAVKVRTFSSRMEVERTKRKPAANKLAMIFAEAFFFPLVGRYQQDVAAYASASVFASTPFLLVTFLKTLALLLHASGPATLGLPQVTTEFWDLLLGLRTFAAGDISVLEAVLFSLLTLLEMNGDKRRIADEHAKQLMETQQWVNIIFERTGGGNYISDANDEEARIRTLAAGVLVKTGEIIEAYQKALVGSYTEF